MSQPLSTGAIDETSGDEEFARQLQMRFNAEDMSIIDIDELVFEKGKVMDFLRAKYPKALEECQYSIIDEITLKECQYSIIDEINKKVQMRQSNVQLVATLATTIKDKLPSKIKNRVSFCFYAATWKAMIGSRETAQFLFGVDWGGHWGWWIQTAIERQTVPNWQSIIKQMKDFGLDIKSNNILFENSVLRLKLFGTTNFTVQYKQE